MHATAYERWFEVEGHFWRVGRRRFLIELIEDRPPRNPAGGRARVLDIGGACSILSQDLQRFGDLTMVEPEPKTAEFARATLGLDVHVGRLPNDLGVEGPFDLITLFDVIEHVEDDAAAMRTIHDLLRPGGSLVISVPALRALWGDHDVASHHFRRYERRDFHALLEGAGFRIRRESFFISLLFPLIYAQRRWNQLRGVDPHAEFDVRVPRAPLNRILTGVMDLERLLLRRTDLPIGSSLVAVCERDG